MSTDLRLKESLPELARAIVDTYTADDPINHLGHCPLPSHKIVVDVLEKLKEILYPGYGQRDRLHHGNVIYHVGDLIDHLHDQLLHQIARALCHQAGKDTSCSPEQRNDFEHIGQTKAVEFLRMIPDIRAALADDVRAAYDGDPACRTYDEVIFCYPGLEAITVYRIANSLHQLGVPLIPRMMTEWAHSRTGIDIHPGATIGDRFFIDHGTGVVIGETCVIGNNVKLYQGVTLGALSFPSDEEGNLVRGTKRHPTIEDRVVIYANATVLGGETVIGHDAVIGASTWITSSVEPMSTVILEKPKMKVRTA